MASAKCPHTLNKPVVGEVRSMVAVRIRRKHRQCRARRSRTVTCSCRRGHKGMSGHKTLCRNVDRGIHHVTDAIDRFRRARHSTGSRVTREILDTNIRMLRVIRDEKKRLFQRHCSYRTYSCRGRKRGSCCHSPRQRRPMWQDYLLGRDGGYGC